MASISDFLRANNVTGLTDDSRAVAEGMCFLVMPGAVRDGADFVRSALQAGAACVIAHPSQADAAKAHWQAAGEAVPFFACESEQDVIAALLHCYPSEMQAMVAVTGTDGKSSVVHFVRQLWEHAGKAAVSLGTIGVEGAAAQALEHESLGNTTPGVVMLYRVMHKLTAMDVTHLAMEVSSHALVQGRVAGVQYNAAAFTNLSHEHLDYHGTMEEYFLAKAQLFTNHLAGDGKAVICMDDAHGKRLSTMVGAQQCWGYGRDERAEFRLLDYSAHGQGAHVRVSMQSEIWEGDIALIGAFQIMNMLAASGLAVATGVAVSDVMAAWPRLTGAAGRMQCVSDAESDLSVLVDYAHTPGALEHVLKASRPHCAGALWVVFGCGGDRDNAKRPIMGGLASDLADVAILTDDNPRTEDAADIRAQVRVGMNGAAQAHEIGDRAEAIAYAIAHAKAGDMVVITGKGHEKEQIICTVTHPFDDVAVAQECLK